MDETGSIKQLMRPFWAAVAVILPLVGVFIYERISGNQLTDLGLYPRSFGGLKGIFFMPLLHGDWSHLLSNVSALFVLSWLGFHTFGRLYVLMLFFIWAATGTWTWFFARESYHIGASGIVYGVAVFSLVSGFLSKNKMLQGLALITVFLYGSFLWGVFPWEYTRDFSWEGHLSGALAGLILALVFRKDMPAEPEYSWENDPADVRDSEDGYGSMESGESGEEKYPPRDSGPPE